MLDSIYKNMIEDSPIPHIHIKLIEDEFGDYESIRIMGYNKAYKKSFIKNKNFDFKSFIVNPRDKKEKIAWNNLFESAIKNKKHTVEEYVDSIGECLNIDIYSAGQNEFHLRLNRISKQQDKLFEVLKNSPFVAWMKDRDGRVIDVNQKYLESLNKTYDEVVGKTNFEIVDEVRAKFIKEQDDQVIRENKMFRYEDYLANPLNKDGYYEVFKWPYMNEKETFTLGTIGIGIDISENVKLRKKLEETEERFLEIANNIKDIIIIKDEKKVHYINPAFEKIYGFKPDELYEDVNKWYDYWDNIEFEKEPTPFESNETYVSNFKLSKEGQDDKWMWSRFVPILDENGKVIKQIGILSDITEHKSMETEVENLKMDFIANLSHELRTPINLILSALQVLHLKMDKLDLETLDYFTNYLNIISQNGRRLLKLVNNLIDTTKLDAGCFDYNPENNDIVRYVEDICMSISPFVNTNDLEIIFDTDEEEKVISFDPDNMERIILNLLSNAIKFNKPNGKIEVTMSCKEDIKISIKDSGVGIPEEKLESIFERYEQVKNQFKQEKQGSGIGLSLVKSLVEMHNGTISVNSVYGEGSEFVITLPDMLTNSQKSGINKVPGYLSDLNKMRIEFSDIYI